MESSDAYLLDDDSTVACKDSQHQLNGVKSGEHIGIDGVTPPSVTHPTSMGVTDVSRWRWKAGRKSLDVN